MEKENKVTEVADQLNKKFGCLVIQPAAKMRGLTIARVPSQILSLHIEIGGGWPKSRIIEIFGPESTAKTAVCLVTVIDFQQFILDKPCLWIDMEGVFDSVWAEKVGVDLSRLEVAKPETAEQAGTILDAGTRSNSYSLIVLDSVAAMLPEEDLDKPMDEKERIGNRASTNNRIVRKLQSALNALDLESNMRPETTLLLINQVREKIGIVYGNPEESTGGRGIRFAASIRIETRRGDLIKEKSQEGESGENKDGEIVIGSIFKFHIKKNKTFPPFRTGQFILYTSRENAGKIDRADEIVRYGITAGIIKHSGHSYQIGEKKLNGIDNLKEYMKENPEALEKLHQEILEIYSKENSV